MAYTVVSVGPYPLIITRPGAHRSTTSGGHASAATINADTDDNFSGSKTPTAEGVWLNTVTPSATTNASKSCGERVVCSGTTTKRPPCSSAPQISHTEKSNANDEHAAHTCRGPNSTPTSMPSNNRVTF
nr:hypothetical protein CPGR_00813 [Mycolicibacterium fortuitum subsp. fortuitum DSM 46621 = ATCC 6841 = JCM 6387]